MNAPMSPELRAEMIETKQFTGKALKLMKLLGAGCTQVEASKACGIDESYTAQLMADPEFKNQVDELIKKAFEVQSAIDQNYLSIEEKLSKRLLGSIEHEFNPDRILRTLKYVNEAKKKVSPTPSSEGAGDGSGGPTQVAILVLPTVVASHFVKNPQGEVISVNGQVLTTLPSKTMDAFAEHNTKLKHERLKQLTEKSNGSGHSDPYADL